MMFAGPMVRALLDGRKTQTRRLVRPFDAAFLRDLSGEDGSPPAILYSETGHGGPGWYVACEDYPDEGSHFMRCPYGVPGDRLWVRETLHLREGGEFPNRSCGWRYDADGTLVLVDPGSESEMLAWARHKAGGVCPSIHMPRWACRLVLELTSVRVQRLQDITEADAQAEGVPPEAPQRAMFGLKPRSAPVWVKCSHREAFAVLWDELNGKRAPWSSNPWVWVLEVRVAGTHQRGGQHG